ESLHDMLAVFPGPAEQIVGYAGVERPQLSACEDIDEVAFRHRRLCHRWTPDSRCAASGATVLFIDHGRHPGKGEALVRGPFFPLRRRQPAAWTARLAITLIRCARYSAEAWMSL